LDSPVRDNARDSMSPSNPALPPGTSATTAPESSHSETTTIVTTATQSFAPGQMLGTRYRIHALLGRGGMGEVWQAYDLKLQVEVALKSIRPGRFGGGNGLELLRNEVRSAREVISPNVCRIFDLVEENGCEFVSMEYIDGMTLLALLRERAPLPIPEATRIAAQFLAGLEAIHQAGLVHRDVKPENIMITRTGRVLLMDFGIAKGLTEDQAGTIAGTPAYMAPEQGRGEAIDARADIFAAGVTLAEMIAPAGLHDHSTRKSIWDAVRHEPVQLFDSPWRRVLERTVAPRAPDRYESARELLRALEEVPQRIAGAEDKRPYPGLASFTAADAEFFFGRELDVEAVWKKLQHIYLLAIIGPSGAGKTSFLHAGLIPAMPREWCHRVIRPGSTPFAALGHALVPELLGDLEATQALIRLDDPKKALLAARRWRAAHAQVLLVVDQFEELFTLCRPDVQTSFADLLGHLAIEADVHVLLSMRDDFLFHCHDHPRLAPIFSDLTPLGPPAGSALRRALVQPGLLCGYRFDDETLADDMLDAVVGERGALPLLAFAASRLWEKRNPERGLLTRAAYDEIGGVTGALAQHAEATLERIGMEREPLVREIFRNLVTSQGTRTVIEIDELLSVFKDREAVVDVLHQLVTARLLTTFETEDESGKERRSVEIVHESLLAKWPRLVRWQTQDADSAQFRDQLRQQTRLWEERGRPADLLWTGSSYREFASWQERYPGGLTANELSYVQAMTAEAERLKRRRRRILTATVASLAAVIAIVTTLWIRAQNAQRLSEANRLNALARLEIDRNPTTALAYAIASLELHDSPPARKFAIEVLLTGPPSIPLFPNSFRIGRDSLECGCENSRLTWSPDGRWLAQACAEEAVRVWSRNGGPPLVLRAPDATSRGMGVYRFGPNSDVLACSTEDGRKVRFWSIPGGEPLRTMELKPGTRARLLTSYVRLSTQPSPQSPVRRWEALSYATGAVTSLGERTWPQQFTGFNTDDTGEWSAYAQADDLYVIRTDSLNTGKAHLVGRHVGFNGAVLRPGRDLVASWDWTDSAACRIWSMTSESRQPIWTLHEAMGMGKLVFDPTGTMVTAGQGILDLTSAPGTPFAVVNPKPPLGAGPMFEAAFHPHEKWFAAAFNWSIAGIMPLSHAYPRTLYQHRAIHLRFTPDGRTLVSAGYDGILRAWSLERGPHQGSRILLKETGVNVELYGFCLSRSSKLAVVGSTGGNVYTVPLQGGGPRRLEGFRTLAAIVAIDSSDRYVAAAGGENDVREAQIRVWDLQTGEVKLLDPGERKRLNALLFLPNGELLSGGDGGLRRWNVQAGTHEILRPEATADDGLRLLPDGHSVRCSLRRAGRPATAEILIWDSTTNTWQHFATGEHRLNADGTLYTLDDNDVLAVGRVTWPAPGSGDAVFEEPHLVSRLPMDATALSPDGQLAAISSKGDVLIVPIPAGAPMQLLPRHEFLARLRAMTSVRAVPDSHASNGYRLDVERFPGWKTPAW